MRIIAASVQQDGSLRYRTDDGSVWRIVDRGHNDDAFRIELIARGRIPPPVPDEEQIVEDVEP